MKVLSRNWPFRLSAFSVALGVFLVIPPSLLAQTGSAQVALDKTSGRTRIAEGEYQVLRTVNGGGVGPFAPMVYNFRESWTLWKLPDGTYEAEGERTYESPKDEPHHNPFSVHLSHAFRVLGLTEFRPLRWRRDSGPLTCDFLTSKLTCTSNAKDAGQNIHLDVPMQNDYGFLWPISAFSISGITRSVDRDRIPVQLVSVDEPNSENPVYTSILDGYVQYMGDETLLTAGQKWHADKFELKVPMHPPFLIWTSPQGLLLSFAEENQQGAQANDGMKLVRFKQWLNF